MRTERVVLAAIPAVVLGCTGSSVPSLRDINDTNMKKLRGAYGLFIVRLNMRGAEGEEELKEFMRADGGVVAKTKEMGDGPDDIAGSSSASATASRFGSDTDWAGSGTTL